MSTKQFVKGGNVWVYGYGSEPRKGTIIGTPLSTQLFVELDEPIPGKVNPDFFFYKNCKSKRVKMKWVLYRLLSMFFVL